MNHSVANIDSATYTVSLWSTDPALEDSEGNCMFGKDFATQGEAESFIASLETNFDLAYYCDVPFVMIDGPNLHKVSVRECIRPSHRVHDNDWQREGAMQAGMAGGCEAYNDYMGY